MRLRRDVASSLFAALLLATAYLGGRGVSQLLYGQILDQFPERVGPPQQPASSAGPLRKPPAPRPPSPPLAEAERPSAPAAPPPPPPAPQPSLAPAAPEAPRDQLGRVRVTPERVDGRIAGIRLWGIRDESLLSLLGLRSGDRLEAINGYELGTPENALRAYSELRQRSDFELVLIRDGRTIRHTYHVR
jgi:general secretion pathway protein C